MSNLICNSTELDQIFYLHGTDDFSCPDCCISSEVLFDQECRWIATKISLDEDECTLSCIGGGFYYSNRMKLPQCVPGMTIRAQAIRSVGNTAIKQTHNLFILVLFVVMLGLFFRK